MDRFWNKVDKTISCWIWTASGRGQGYGAFKYKGKVYDAHRFSWYLAHGEFSKQWILHNCNNRKCVNSKHLYEGTPKQNYADMRASGNEPNKDKKYLSSQEQKKAAWRRWYQRVKNEPGQARYKRWRKTQKLRK